MLSRRAHKQEYAEAKGVAKKKTKGKKKPKEE